MLIISNGKH